MTVPPKGLPPRRGEGERAELAANEASSPAEQFALRRPLDLTITLLNRSAAAERLFPDRPFA